MSQQESVPRGKVRNPGILEAYKIRRNPMEFDGIKWNPTEAKGIVESDRIE